MRRRGCYGRRVAQALAGDGRHHGDAHHPCARRGRDAVRPHRRHVGPARQAHRRPTHGMAKGARLAHRGRGILRCDHESPLAPASGRIAQGIRHARNRPMRRATWIRTLVVVGFVLLLEGLCRWGVIGRMTMIPPSAMAEHLWKLLQEGRYNEDIAQTLRNVLGAFVLAVVGGFVLGSLLHAWPRARRAVDPFLATYYAIPFFAFYPLLVVIFGLGSAPIILIGFLFGVVAMILNTMNGLDRIP